MKDKIICILFVIVLTFLVLGVDAQAETVGAPYTDDISVFGDINVSYMRWIESFTNSNSKQEFDNYIYPTSGGKFLIFSVNGGENIYALVRADETTVYNLVRRQTKGYPVFTDWLVCQAVNDLNTDKVKLYKVIGTVPYSSSWVDGYSYDNAFETEADMIAYVNDNIDSLVDGDGNIVLPDDGDNEENINLPAMQYNVSRKWAPKPLTNILAYNAWVEWDYMLYELYKNNPADYKVQLYVQKGFSYKPDSGSEILAQGEMKHILDRNIVDNVMTFSLDKTGNDLYGDDWFVSATHNNPNFYYAYVRISSLDEKSHSKWQCFQCSKSSISNIGEVDIGDKDSLGFTHITKNSDGDVNLDDSAFHKDPNGDKTTASTDPSSALYDGNSLSFDNIVSNIKSVVASVNAVADLLTSVYGWFPQWLINLIVAGIGAVVVVGLFKLIK